MLPIINIFIGVLIVDVAAVIFVKMVSKNSMRRSKLDIIITLIVLVSFHTLISIFFSNVQKSLIILLAYIVFFAYLFKMKVGLSIFLTFIFFALVIFADTFVTITTLKVLKIDSDFYYNVLAGGIFTNLVVALLILIIATFLKNKIYKLTKFKIEINKQLILYIILALVGINLFFWSGFANIELGPALYINLFLISIFIFIIIDLIKQVFMNRNLTLEYDRLMKYVKIYEDIIEKQRMEQHENKNQLLTIKSKIFDKEKKDQIIAYIDGLYNEKSNFDKIKYARLKYIPANGLKGLLYFKIDEAESKNIKVSLQVSKEIEKSILYSMNTEVYKQLCRILGVYLDNAIEASSVSQKKLIGIEVYKVDNNAIFIISNSYCNEIDIKKISVSRYSTKGKNRGYGLLFVKNIINSNNSFEEKREITEELYIQKLIVKSNI